MQAQSKAAAPLAVPQFNGLRSTLLARGGHQLIIIALIIIVGLAIYWIQPRFLSPIASTISCEPPASMASSRWE